MAVASAAESASMLLVNPHLLSVGMPACVGRTEADRDRDRETERQACNGNGARREGERERECAARQQPPGLQGELMHRQ